MLSISPVCPTEFYFRITVGVPPTDVVQDAVLHLSGKLWILATWISVNPIVPEVCYASRPYQDPDCSVGATEYVYVNPVVHREPPSLLSRIISFHKRSEPKKNIKASIGKCFASGNIITNIIVAHTISRPTPILFIFSIVLLF